MIYPTSALYQQMTIRFSFTARRYRMLCYDNTKSVEEQ
ncbi:Hypothetical protein EAG7_01723 [Klebsiella aerogenes]|nr:Hypothetical protein EAG7_01723 [Klebsiella aerogenes]CCG30199.1 hypothetical protein [Klebsiella aerogenes EA1509E]